MKFARVHVAAMRLIGCSRELAPMAMRSHEAIPSRQGRVLVQRQSLTARLPEPVPLPVPLYLS